MSRCFQLKTSVQLAVVVVLAVSGTGYCQSADAIIAKYLAELGGIENLRAWKGMKGTGKLIPVAQGGSEVPVVLFFKPPNRQRVEMSVQGARAVYATDGVLPWYCDPTRGAPHPAPLPEEQARELIRNGDEYPFVDFEDKGHTVKLAGREELEGRETWVVTLTRRNGSTSTHFFDAETGRELRYLTTRARGGAEVVEEVIERDFRRVDWLLMPFETEVRTGGQTIRRMVMDSIEVDVELADSLFEMPRSSVPVAVPSGRHILANGKLPPEEWQDAVEVLRSPELVLYAKRDDPYLYLGVKFQGAMHTGADLYLADAAGSQRKLHVSAALGEAELTDGAWSEMRWGENALWTANAVGLIVVDGKRETVPLEGFEFQIHDSLISGETVALMVHLKRPEETVPSGATPSDPCSWRVLRLRGDAAAGSPDSGRSSGPTSSGMP